jgi:hypothetical protein
MRKKALLFTRKKMSISELDALPTGCAWNGCWAHFMGNAPKGWKWLLAYESKRPQAHFLAIAAVDVMRDAVLCPIHAQTLDQSLTPLARDIGNMPQLGNA